MTMCCRSAKAPADVSGRPAHPFQSASLLSRLCWSWPGQVLRLRGNISDGDLWALAKGDSTEDLAARLLGSWQRNVAQCKAENRQPSLTRAFLSAFALQYFVWGLPAWVKAGFILAQTQFLAALLDELREPDSTYNDVHAYLFALGLVLTGMGAILFHHFYFFQAWRAGMRWRMAATALLYDKCLKLRLDALVETSAGRIINLASSDVERFQKMCQYITYMAVAPVEAVIIVWLLWREIEVAALAGVAVIVVFIIIQAFFSKRFGKLRHETAQITDERVRLTGQVISGIRVLKMYGWEPPFRAKVVNAREREMKKVTSSSWLRGINEGMYVAAPTLIAGAAFLTYNALGPSYVLTARKIFVSMSLFVLLQLDVSKFLQLGLESLAEVRITFQRMQEFLLLPETPTITENPAVDVGDAEGVSVKVDSLTCYWTSAAKERDHATLRNISCSVNNGSLVAVVGPVGAGKTSLLMAMLRELDSAAGSVELHGKVAYVSQNPWIISGSVRDNILFGLEYDEAKYAQVVSACSLTRDFSLFANGDKEMIGERGINLSGGQRARIGLARACYTGADIFLLDDPLSAVDARVGRELFETCLCGYLASKTRILVTHQLQYLRAADNILILAHGEVVMQGTFTDLANALTAAEAVQSTTGDAAANLGAALAEMFRDFGAESESEDDEQPRRRASTSNSIVSPQDAVHRARSIIMRSTESQQDKATKSQQTSTPPSTPSGPSPPPEQADAPAAPVAPVAIVAPDAGDIVQAEKMATGSVSLSTFQRYWSSAGGMFMGLYILFLLAAGAGMITFTSVWLATWSNQSATEQKNRYYPAVYGGLVAICLIVSLWRSIAFFLGSMKASKNLHASAFTRVLQAPVSFYDANPAGRILNRFGKDLGLIDDMLPAAFFDFSSTTMLLTASVILVIVINPWVALSLPILAASFFYLRRYYMKSARVIKRMESTSRSPIYSIMNEVLGGLPVIRAFRMQGMLWSKYVAASDENLRAYFAFLATSRWVGFRLDAICLGLLIATAFASVAARKLASPSLVGLILSQIITLAGAFQWTVRQSAEVENQMVSVERILEYTELPIEEIDLRDTSDQVMVDTDGGQKLWPTAGKITMSDVRMRYRPDMPHVLRGLSCVINPGMKVGVVGRTGAGKSSLLLAILRLVEPDRSEITDEKGVKHTVCGISVDGLDIAEVPLSTLRRSISTIPQDPVLYSGTIRSNLDPFSMHTDAECAQALQRVQLLEFVEHQGGLGYEVAEGGANLSVGQRQLICLSRALLRNSKIILMDEATANVDADTDAAIQHAIRHAFRDATVITIAHRLGTVIDADALLVMDHGQALEFGHPHELLNAGGVFAGLVAETGPKIAADLTLQASAAFAAQPPRQTIGLNDDGSEGYETASANDPAELSSDSNFLGAHMNTFSAMEYGGRTNPRLQLDQKRKQNTTASDIETNSPGYRRSHSESVSSFVRTSPELDERTEDDSVGGSQVLYGVSPKLVRFTPPVSTPHRSQQLLIAVPLPARDDAHGWSHLSSSFTEHELEGGSARASSIVFRDAPSTASTEDRPNSGLGLGLGAGVGLAPFAASTTSSLDGVLGIGVVPSPASTISPAIPHDVLLDAHATVDHTAEVLTTPVKRPHGQQGFSASKPSGSSTKGTFLARVAESLEGLRLSNFDSPVDEAAPRKQTSATAAHHVRHSSGNSALSPEVERLSVEPGHARASTASSAISGVQAAYSQLQSRHAGQPTLSVVAASSTRTGRVPVKGIRINLPSLPTPPASPVAPRQTIHARRSSSTNSLGSIANLLNTPQQATQPILHINANMPSLSLCSEPSPSHHAGSQEVLRVLPQSISKLHAMLSTPPFALPSYPHTTMTPTSPWTGHSSPTAAFGQDAHNSRTRHDSFDSAMGSVAGARTFPEVATDDDTPQRNRPIPPAPLQVDGRSPMSAQSVTPAEVVGHLPPWLGVANHLSEAPHPPNRPVPIQETKPETLRDASQKLQESQAWTERSQSHGGHVAQAVPVRAAIPAFVAPGAAPMSSARSYGNPSPINFSQQAPFRLCVNQPAPMPASLLPDSAREAEIPSHVFAEGFTSYSPAANPNPHGFQRASKHIGVQEAVSDSPTKSPVSPYRAVIARARSSAFTGRRPMPPPVPAHRQVSAPPGQRMFDSAGVLGSMVSAFVPRSSSAFRGRQSPTDSPLASSELWQ